MLLIESKIGSVNRYDLVDGSIGIRWSNYRKNKPWIAKESYYPHEYNDNRGSRDCKCYHDIELPYFLRWLKREYRQNHLYTYLSDKYRKDGNKAMLNRVEDVLPKLLARGSSKKR